MKCKRKAREKVKGNTRNTIQGKAWEILQGKWERRHGQPASGKKEDGLKWPIGIKREHVPQERVMLGYAGRMHWEK